MNKFIRQNKVFTHSSEQWVHHPFVGCGNMGQLLPARQKILGEVGDSNPTGGRWELAGGLDGNPGHPQETLERDPTSYLQVGIQGSLKCWAKLKVRNVTTEAVFDKDLFLSQPHEKYAPLETVRVVDVLPMLLRAHARHLPWMQLESILYGTGYPLIPLSAGRLPRYWKCARNTFQLLYIHSDMLCGLHQFTAQSVLIVPTEQVSW